MRLQERILPIRNAPKEEVKIDHSTVTDAHFVIPREYEGLPLEVVDLYVASERKRFLRKRRKFAQIAEIQPGSRIGFAYTQNTKILNDESMRWSQDSATFAVGSSFNENARLLGYWVPVEALGNSSEDLHEAPDKEGRSHHY